MSFISMPFKILCQIIFSHDDQTLIILSSKDWSGQEGRCILLAYHETFFHMLEFLWWQHFIMGLRQGWQQEN